MRGLFVKHTRTGNPLVDSVAEHQPASAQAYKQYLSKVYDIAPWGFVFSFLNLSDANTFVILYAIVAYYFSSKMARLVILLGPVSSALGGVAIGFALTSSSIYYVPGSSSAHRRAAHGARRASSPSSRRRGAAARRRRRQRRRQGRREERQVTKASGLEGEETKTKKPEPKGSAEYDEPAADEKEEAVAAPRR